MTERPFPNPFDWSQADCRRFAKDYIRQRLAEDHDDAIEELSAYLGNWLWSRQRAQALIGDVLPSLVGDETTEETP